MEELLIFASGIASASAIIVLISILIGRYEERKYLENEMEEIAAAKREEVWEKTREEFKSRKKPAFKSTAPTGPGGIVDAKRDQFAIGNGYKSDDLARLSSASPFASSDSPSSSSDGGSRGWSDQ